MGTQSLSPFDLVCQNLRGIGALTISEYLSAGPESHISQKYTNPSLPVPPPPPLAGPSAVINVAETLVQESKLVYDATQNVSRLHHACQRAFGHSGGLGYSSALRFDFLEDGVDKKQCILTLTRPNGATRSYKTEPVFRRKHDAKYHAATIAIENGALEFITNGDSDTLKAKKGTLLEPLDKTEDETPIASSSKLASQVAEIEACCEHWRGPSVRPIWLNFDEPKLPPNKYGAALRIQLTAHLYRVYSCEPAFDSRSLARENCAVLAVGEGVLDFIRYGNGQTKPRSEASVVATSPTEPRSPSSLQSFYESLPRPFEEASEDKTAIEVNAPFYLHSVLNSAKGARFSASFHALGAAGNGASRLQGCLLRLNRPGECRSYLVDPQFSSHKEARVAVSLLALYQGAAKYIREVAAAVEAKVSPEMRKFVLSVVLPALDAESMRISGVSPRFQYSNVDDAHGCSLQISLTSKFNNTRSNTREYSVPPEYRSKIDARIAVTYLAAEQGVIDLLKFGGDPPPGHPPTFDFSAGVPQIGKKNKKRRQRKKLKTAHDNAVALDLPKIFPQKPQFSKGNMGRGGSIAAGPSQKRRRSASLEDGELTESE
ncbi:hypothetical protein C8J57DRAFT_1174939 [Mycena rebaudengoi]|nr:hypothetical protein C8J57DRAFT_1174939 [Mycena rebaudengoi]